MKLTVKQLRKMIMSEVKNKKLNENGQYLSAGEMIAVLSEFDDDAPVCASDAGDGIGDVLISIEFTPSNVFVTSDGIAILLDTEEEDEIDEILNDCGLSRNDGYVKRAPVFNL